MKCWVTQKILPLYIGNDDPPISHYFIERHLESCSCCSAKYQSYKEIQQRLKNLKEIYPPQYLTADNYWQEIRSRIASPLRQPSYPPMERTQSVFRFLMTTAILLLIGVTIYTRFYVPEMPSATAAPAKIPLSSSSPSEIKSNFKLTPPETRLIPLNKEESEYEFNEVSPVELKKGSF